MNILVIGNGFDLAHGLPTKYGDFLEFCKKVEIIYTARSTLTPESYENKNLVKWEIDDKIKKDLQEAFVSRKESEKSKWDTDRFETDNPILDEFYSLIKDNLWVEYFNNCNENEKENWIDFESEICNVIKSVDIGMKNRNDNMNSIISGLENSFLNKKFLNNQCDILAENLYGKKIFNKKEPITYKHLIERLEIDLDRLIRALEIYLAEYVDVINDTEECKAIQGVNPDCILSFNYSNTYERLYGNGKKIEYNYIHGKADINNTVESNNMVLGIDEYLEPERMNKEISFIAFKKYYQRIYKGTGCEYRDWIYKIKESAKSIELKLRNEYPVQIPFIKYTNDARHNLYIFGHSLDVTDQDILRELILNDNVYTTIFYMNKKDLKRKIANLVKVLTQDELIKRTGGSTKTIEFKMQ